MKSPLLLDCTLRDGGFVNDWLFGFGSIKSIISRLDYAGVDIIEVGFIDERREYDENRSIFPDTDCILPLFEGYHKSNALIVGMIDYKTCDIDKISNRAQSCLDGIRVIFKKSDQDGALEFLGKIKEKGYNIFVNPVSTTEYAEDEIITLIEKINEINPYAVSIVDTYGLMHSIELMNYIDIFDSKLNEDIILGYHAHNNFQMAYANSIFLMERITNRTISIDGSLYGMGKSAGNACTELLAMYMNKFCGRDFCIHQIQEAIDVDILKEFNKKPWGYNFEYYVAALNDCHPSYVHHLTNKKTLSTKSINDILSGISMDKKLIYDEKLIETLYLHYNNNYCNDAQVAEALKKEFSDRKVLLLGPGKTLVDNYPAVDSFIQKNKPLIISINFIIKSFPINYVFMGNAKRYSQFFHEMYRDDTDAKIICTSNITEPGNKFDYVVNYSALLAENPVIRDNPLIMFLQLLKNIAVTEIWMAGFDGYTQDNSINYYTDYIRLLFCQDNVVLRNEAIKDWLTDNSSAIQVNSLTPTRYL